MTRDAFAAGAVPDPVSDLVDWYYLRHEAVRSNDLADIFTREFDIRTSRRIRGQDRTLIAVFDNPAASGVAVDVSISVRLLLQRS